MAITLTFDDVNKGWVTSWKYTWEDMVAYMNDRGDYSKSGKLLPTPSDARTTIYESFSWHHLAPHVGFKVWRSGSTIKITSIDESSYSNVNFPYSTYNPTISFYYHNGSNYVLIGSFGTESDYKGATREATYNASYADIYVACGDSSCSLGSDVKHHIGKIKLHTHIGDISGPTLSSITATSITASGGEEVCLVTNGTDGTWYKSPHTFTGLNKATTYSFKCRKKCPDCSEGVIRYSTASAKTWGITGSCLSSGAKSLTYTATYTKGDGYADYNPAITYYLYESKDGNYVKGPIQKNNGVSATFTGLDPSKTYYCKACTNGIDDNWMWIDGNTKASASISGSGGDVSAKSLRASVSWNVGEASSVECTVTCNGTSKTLSTNGGNIGFTGLDPGSNYMVSYSIVSTYEYTYTVIKNGELVTETDYDTDTITDSFNLTTKIASFGDCESTSKIIRFKSNSNYNDNTMEHRLNSSDWVEVEQDTYTLYNNLKHNTSYTIYARIKDCYAFNSSGNITSINDSVISKTVNTLLLSLNASISEEHQHSLITLWQAYVDGNKTDKDAIDGTEFAFTKVSTRAKKSNPPYQASEVIEGVDGNTNANYQLDKKVYSNNLTWYYCEYIVSAEITDGYNKVNAEITAHTLFPAKWIYSGGQWHRYMGHVYTNGKWVPAPEFVYTDNYIEPNGE